MARFFLFTFTVLLSLSLGLFVGQNYFLGSDEDYNEQTIDDPTLTEKLNTFKTDTSSKFKNFFNKTMDKIFAEEDLPKPISTEKSEKSKPNNFDKDNKANIGETIAQNIDKVEPLDIKAESPKTDKTQISQPKVAIKKVEIKKDIIKPTPQPVELTNQTGWVIQVASFQAERDALKIVEQIQNNNFPHFFYKANLNGQNWYRVNIGPFNSVTEATNFKKTNKVAQKFKGAFVKKL